MSVGRKRGQRGGVQYKVRATVPHNLVQYNCHKTAAYCPNCTHNMAELYTELNNLFVCEICRYAWRRVQNRSKG